MENDISLSFAGNEFWMIGVSGICLILLVEFLSSSVRKYKN